MLRSIRLIVGVPLLLSSGLAQACIEKSCPIDPVSGDYECPLGTMMIQPEAAATPVAKSASCAVPVLMECAASGGGMLCEGWSQEVSVPKRYINYAWSVRVGFQTTQYQTGDIPYVNFSCNTGQSVAVTMTLTNGSFSGTSSQSYTCGDIIE